MPLPAVMALSMATESIALPSPFRAVVLTLELAAFATPTGATPTLVRRTGCSASEVLKSFSEGILVNVGVGSKGDVECDLAAARDLWRRCSSVSGVTGTVEHCEADSIVLEEGVRHLAVCARV
ncbi:hypothetical protein [Lentzea albidocapillata]|uniref:hypothetical protein n=1 Tax=Lentzea albidocapillata TaxID=40571 RepID=UPI00115F838C|nr:hypothetical protein [Lentzea albidocapillata]